MILEIGNNVIAGAKIKVSQMMVTMQGKTTHMIIFIIIPI